MRIAIRRIGKSKEMLIPLSRLAQIGATTHAEVSAEDGALMVRAAAKPARSRWARASKQAKRLAGEDVLLLPEFENAQDAQLAW